MASVSKRVWTHKDVEKTAWVVRYKEGGKHRSKQFERKKEADKFRQKMEALAASGDGIVDSSITVSEVCNLFLNTQEDRLRDGRIGRATYSRTKIDIEVSIKPILGHIVMAELTSIQLESAYQTMIKTGNLHPRTAVERIKKCGRVCRYAVKHGYARKDVAEAAVVELRGIAPAAVRTFTHGDLRPKFPPD